MDEKHNLIHVIFVLLTIIMICDVMHAIEIPSQERFEYADPHQYSYATTLVPITPTTLLRCASKCVIRGSSCDGFYYDFNSKACVLGSRFLHRRTTASYVLNSDIYVKESYELTTHCPTSKAFKLVTVGGKKYCLIDRDGTKRSYWDAQAFCHERGASLLYLRGDIAGDTTDLKDIMDQLGIGWSSGWRGAHQHSVGSSQWMWSYSGTYLTQEELTGYNIAARSCDTCQTCMLFETTTPGQLKQKDCGLTDDFVCEIVLF